MMVGNRAKRRRVLPCARGLFQILPHWVSRLEASGRVRVGVRVRVRPIPDITSLGVKVTAINPITSLGVKVTAINPINLRSNQFEVPKVGPINLRSQVGPE